MNKTSEYNHLTEMSVQDIRNLKKKYGLSNAALSDESGVPLGTVNKVLSGATECPRSETLSALAKPLREREIRNQQLAASLSVSSMHSSAAYSEKSVPADSMIREEAISYGAPSDKAQGNFTIDDYYAMSDEHRVELIDGYFYDLAAPTTIHQSIALAFAFNVTAFIRSHAGDCVPFISPIDVILDPPDRKTIVQPDFLIVCDPSKIQEKCILGAPDFVLEIISPSTSAKDYYKKTAKYQAAGVREYWIIDPIRKNLTVFYFETEEPVLVCPLRGKVSIGIYHGELEIDLDEIGKICS